MTGTIKPWFTLIMIKLHYIYIFGLDLGHKEWGNWEQILVVFESTKKKKQTKQTNFKHQKGKS